jgi:hypothetical protein
MTKKALLVALDGYELTAPTQELARWQELLKELYKFDEVVSLKNQNATNQGILKALDSLLDAASANDQLLFVFMGHGTLDKKGGQRSQALLVYDGTVVRREIDAVFARTRPPRGTDITFVLDCCFAADYRTRMKSSNVAVDAIPLFVPPPMEIMTDRSEVRAFDMAFSTIHKDVEEPIIFAASGKNRPAYEIPDGRERRLLFSKRLLAQLPQKYDTFEGIRDKINLLHPRIQEATLLGNLSRQKEWFPGQSPSDSGNTDEPPLSPTIDDDAADALARTTAATANSIDLRILGLGCFVESRDTANDPYQVRVILPFDEGKYATGNDRHFACIEIAEDDIEGSFTGTTPTEHFRGGVRYLRWLLQGHTLSIQTGVPNQDFTRSPEFDQHVPVMTVLCPELLPRNPRPECFEPVPRPDLFAAFVDVPGGSVDIGSLDEHSTFFQRRNGDITWGSETTPITVRVNVPLVTDFATILLRPYPRFDRPDLEVQLKPGRTMLIANAREVDISGDGTHDGTPGTVPSTQFLLYYKLSTFVPSDPPLPQTDQAPIDACSVTSWP